MRILFCDMPTSSTDKFGRLHRFGSTYPPYNLVALGSYMQHCGHTVQISTDQETLEEVRGIARSFRPSLICLTMVSLGITKLPSMLAALHEEVPDAKIVLGGYHASLFPEEVLRDHALLDVVFVGEGEYSLKAYVERLDDGSLDIDSLKEVRGICFRNGDGGDIVRTEAAQMVENLDSLPFPDYSLLPDCFQRFRGGLNRHFLANPQIFFLSSKGCPFSCYFCGRQILGSKIRAHSVEYIIDMLAENKKRYGIKSVTFGDEFFTYDSARTQHFCEAIHRAGLSDIHWVCSGRTNMMTPELARTLRQGGCLQISYGCESGSQDILDAIGKRANVDQMEQAIGDAANAGLSVMSNFMIGCPGETKDTLELTRSFILRNRFDFITLTYFTPLPGSRFYDSTEYEKYGSFISQDPSDQNLFGTATFIPHGLSREDLYEANRRIYRDFYLRPQRIFSELRHALNPASWKYFLRVAFQS